MAHFPERYYRSFTIPKANGSRREITAPRIFLKTVQRHILDHILNSCQLHTAAVGFRQGCSLLTGAQQHIKRKYVWNIDLKDFFPSIKREEIKDLFLKLKYSDSAAHFLSGLCCLNGSLPQGAPTSPMISNAVFFEIDEKLDGYAKNHGIKYTRYADDLTFSATEPISRELREYVFNTISLRGYKINRKKSRLLGPATRREVTGLVVNESVGIPRERRREIRALFHNAILRPYEFTARIQHLRGIAAWVSQYHPNEAFQYIDVCDEISRSH